MTLPGPPYLTPTPTSPGRYLVRKRWARLLCNCMSTQAVTCTVVRIGQDKELQKVRLALKERVSHSARIRNVLYTFGKIRFPNSAQLSMTNISTPGLILSIPGLILSPHAFFSTAHRISLLARLLGRKLSGCYCDPGLADPVFDVRSNLLQYL